MFTRIHFKFGAILSLLFLSSCNFSPSVTVPAIKIPPVTVTSGSSSFSTSASLTCAAAITGSVNSDQPVPVIVQAAGGSAPYTVTGAVGSFLSSMTLSKTYTNDSLTSSVVNDTITVTDSTGATTTCALTITVASATSPSSFACDLSASSASPTLGSPVTFTVKASGGTSPYTFGNLIAGNGGVVSSDFSASANATQSSATASYSAKGLSTASTSVKDSAGNTVSCSKNLNVVDVPRITVTATPSNVVSSGSTITLVASSSGFSGNVTYTFVSVDSSALITPNGSAATVAVGDNGAHNFDVLVTAKDSIGTASATIHLSFVANLNLTCSMNHASGNYLPGQIVNFNLAASTGEALTVTYFWAQDGVIQSTTLSSTIPVTFNSAGLKSVVAYARSANTGTSCNNGAALSDSITIGSNLSCNVLVTEIPTSMNKPICVGSSNVNAQVIGVSAPQSAYMSVYGYYSNNCVKVSFGNAGTFPITVNVRDGSGNTASCTAYEIVNYYYGY